MSDRSTPSTTVIDLTDSSLPSTPGAAVSSGDDISSTDAALDRSSEAQHFHITEDITNDLPAILEDFEWKVDRVLQTDKDFALVQWKPSVLASRALRRDLNGSKLLDFAHKLEPLGAGMMRVYWGHTWEPLRNVCYEVAGVPCLLDRTHTLPVSPEQIRFELAGSINPKYLVTLRPTWVEACEHIDDLLAALRHTAALSHTPLRWAKIRDIDNGIYQISWSHIYLRRSEHWPLPEFEHDWRRVIAEWDRRSHD